MYVIQRTDKDYGDFIKTHLEFEDARKEAERLARKHVEENPEYTIYELVKSIIVSSKITIKTE